MSDSSVYKSRRFLQVNGGTSLAFTDSLTLSQFKIPANTCWNLSKSYITIDIVAQNWYDAASFLANFFTDCFPINSIRLQSNSGTELAKLDNVQIYTKVSQDLTISMEEYLSNGSIYGDTIPGTAYPITVCSGCQPANSTFSAQRTSGQLLTRFPTEALITDTTAGTYTASLASLSGLLTSHVSGSDSVGKGVHQRLITGVASNNVVGDGNGNLTIKYKIPLKAFVGTLLAVDETLYFREDLTLNIYWQNTSNLGWLNATDVATNRDVSKLQVVSTSNYYLYLQENVNAEKQIEAKNRTRIITPYTISKVYSTPASAGVNTIETTIEPMSGKTLKRIITIPNSAINMFKKTANTFNVNAVKYSTLQSYLNGMPLQDYQLSWSNGDVWNYHYNLIKKSPAGLSLRTFEENTFFIDNFSDADESVKWLENDKNMNGMIVNDAKNYQLQFTQTSTCGLVMCQYQTWSRELDLSGSPKWL